MNQQKSKKIMIIFYSMFGHIETLAREMHKGINSIEGVTGELWRIQETLSEDVLKLMNAPQKSDDIPLLTYDKLDYMTKADGYLFGIPTRFGMMPAQMKAFWDMTGKQWFLGSFVGKPAGTFYSTATMGGGQETTAFTTLTQFIHHGMVYVPIGYTFGPELSEFKEIRGGSAYGAGTYAGDDNKRTPTELELKIARHQGEYMAKFVRRLLTEEELNK